MPRVNCSIRSVCAMGEPIARTRGKLCVSNDRIDERSKRQGCALGTLLHAPDPIGEGREHEDTPCAVTASDESHSILILFADRTDVTRHRPVERRDSTYPARRSASHKPCRKLRGRHGGLEVHSSICWRWSATLTMVAAGYREARIALYDGQSAVQMQSAERPPESRPISSAAPHAALLPSRSLDRMSARSDRRGTSSTFDRNPPQMRRSCPTQ